MARNPPQKIVLALESKRMDGFFSLTPLSSSFQGARNVSFPLNSISQDKKVAPLSEHRVPQLKNQVPHSGNRKPHLGNRIPNSGNQVSLIICPSFDFRL